MASKLDTNPLRRSKKYDLIVVPGLMFGPHWGMRHDLMMRLRVAARLYRWNPGAHIAVCGRWSLWYDRINKKPPLTEAKLMKRYLISLGVDPDHIIMESTSKDLPGVAYYLKRQLRDNKAYRRLMVVCVAAQQDRLRFLFHKFFEAKYTLNYLPVAAPHLTRKVLDDDVLSFKQEKALLRKVRRGHEEDFAHQLYNSTYYTNQVSNIRRSRLTLNQLAPRLSRIVNRAE